MPARIHSFAPASPVGGFRVAALSVSSMSTAPWGFTSTEPVALATTVGSVALSAPILTASGTDVTDAFRMYLRPLLGSGLPDAYRLRPNPVAKVLRP